MAVTGGTIAVSAWRDDDRGLDSGSAYVFVRSGTGCLPQGKLLAGDGAAGDEFGHDLAIGALRVAAGAPADDAGRGAVYVLGWNGAA